MKKTVKIQVTSLTSAAVLSATYNLFFGDGYTHLLEIYADNQGLFPYIAGIIVGFLLFYLGSFITISVLNKVGATPFNEMFTDKGHGPVLWVINSVWCGIFGYFLAKDSGLGFNTETQNVLDFLFQECLFLLLGLFVCLFSAVFSVLLVCFLAWLFASEETENEQKKNLHLVSEKYGKEPTEWMSEIDRLYTRVDLYSSKLSKEEQKKLSSQLATLQAGVDLSEKIVVSATKEQTIVDLLAMIRTVDDNLSQLLVKKDTVQQCELKKLRSMLQENQKLN